MSKVFRTVGAVAGVVATVAAFVPGGQGVAAIAGAVSALSSTAAALTAKQPATQGQINERIIGANNPQPYLMGRSYTAGVQIHDVGYGGRVNGVSNPYRFMATVHSACGPVEELEALQFDYQTISFSGTEATGYYNDYFWRDFKLGERPETALTPHFSGTPDWGSDYETSGFASLGYSFKWSKKGKRFTGGQIPAIGAIWKGVKVYDPRLDTTYAGGGSGSHRIDDESTWEYSTNPALHALAYAYGRYVNGIRVFGVDLGEAAIDLASVVAWANICDTNEWEVSGTIYEPGDKWNNLKRICEAGGAVPQLDGGILKFDYQAPRTSLGSLGIDDLADGQITSRLARSWRERFNTLVPRYRSEAHQWNYVQSAAVSQPDWVTADGEVKETERQFDLVADAGQAAELGLYSLFQLREGGPISLTFKPHLRAYGPGDTLTLLDELGAHPDGDVKAVIRTRTIDPITATVTLEFELESDNKHLIALTAIGTAPDTITLPTAEELDELAYANNGDVSLTADSTQYTADTTQLTADQA